MKFQYMRHVFFHSCVRNVFCFLKYEISVWGEECNRFGYHESEHIRLSRWYDIRWNAEIATTALTFTPVPVCAMNQNNVICAIQLPFSCKTRKQLK